MAVVTKVKAGMVSRVKARIRASFPTKLAFSYDKRLALLRCEGVSLLDVSRIMDRDFPHKNNLTWPVLW